jgi:hypothetical protein
VLALNQGQTRVKTIVDVGSGLFRVLEARESVNQSSLPIELDVSTLEPCSIKNRLFPDITKTRYRTIYQLLSWVFSPKGEAEKTRTA